MKKTKSHIPASERATLCGIDGRAYSEAGRKGVLTRWHSTYWFAGAPGLATCGRCRELWQAYQLASLAPD